MTDRAPPPASHHPFAPPGPAPRPWRVALVLLTALGSAWLSVVATPADAQSAPPEPPANPAASALAEAALSRQREAASVLALTTEGRVLYERDAIKLDGYAYCGQAMALAERGEFRQSIRAASKALYLGLQADDPDLLAVAQRDLSIAYSYAGWLEKAEEYARLALARTAKDPAQAHAPVHKVLGDVAQRRNRPRDALAHYARSLSLASERFRPQVLVSMANAHTAAGESDRALNLLDQVPPAARTPIDAFWQRSRAAALRGAGRDEEALGLLRQVVAGTRRTDADYQRLWAWDGIARIELARQRPEQALAAWGQATTLAETLRGRFRSEEFKTGLFGDVQSVFESALRLAVQREDWPRAWELSEASRARQLLDTVRLRADDRLDDRVSLAQLQQALAPAETVLQYHVLEDMTLAWRIRRDGITGTRLAAGAPELKQDVEALRESIVRRRPTTALQAQALHAKLMPPSLGIDGGRLLLVPHGPLHYLPFQALHDGRRWLIEGMSIASWPSAAVGVQLARRPVLQAPALLAFGNPATDRNVPLPGAEAEVQEIRRLFARQQAFFTTEATRERFKASAAAAGVLHVAAHAELDDVDPMFSRILMASGPEETGLLEAREIYALDLSGVGLVTLSACESGMGRVLRGDEIVGFTRSFLSAGSRSVIASLWPVADDATQLLMTRLYREAVQGSDLMESLRIAQLEVQRNRRFSHPFFWAPFSVIGHGALRLSAS